jgi:site-specific recombinase XerD
VTVVAVGKPEGTEKVRREYLTEKEVEALCDAARARGRYGYRDSLMILVCYRHGLRVSELCALQWDMVDLDAGRLQVKRLKGSDDSVQPLLARVADRIGMAGVHPHLLRHGCGFALVNKGTDTRTIAAFLGHRVLLSGREIRALRRIKREQGVGRRHVFLTERKAPMSANGFYRMQNTVRYTRMDAKRFDGFWQD